MRRSFLHYVVCLLVWRPRSYGITGDAPAVRAPVMHGWALLQICRRFYRRPPRRYLCGGALGVGCVALYYIGVALLVT